MALWLVIAAHYTKREKRFGVFQHHRRNECVERTLAGCDHVVMCRIKIEQRAAIMQDDPGIARNHARPEAFEQAVDERNDISIFVDDGQIDRVAVFTKAWAWIRHCVSS